MSKVGRNTFVAKQEQQIITGSNYRRQSGIHARLKRQNNRIDSEINARRKHWTFVPPTNHTIMLHQDQGEFPAGLVFSVSHEVGCMILHKRLGRIIERDEVAIDAVIEGDIEDVVEAMGLGIVETVEAA
jgi:hypothetical protein